jgi:hypothetical protein
MSDQVSQSSKEGEELTEKMGYQRKKSITINMTASFQTSRNGKNQQPDKKKK